MTAPAADVTTTPAFRAWADEVAWEARRVRFDSSRPPCPAGWCDGECRKACDYGDACLHHGGMASVPCTVTAGPSVSVVGTGQVAVAASRYDELGQPSQVSVDVWIDTLPSGSHATLTSAQAVELALGLLKAVHLADAGAVTP